MAVICFIRKHIINLPLDQIFLTRDFLEYGSRTAVDTVLWRLVEQGMICRVASGVFVRAGSKIPSIEEIAKAKAAAYGKTVGEHCRNYAADLQVGDHARDPKLFGTDGQSSSFRTVHGTVKMLQVGPRRRRLGDSNAGRAIRALWAMKKIDPNWTALAVSMLTQDDRQQLVKLIRWMPAWLGNHFVRGRRRAVSPEDLKSVTKVSDEQAA